MEKLALDPGSKLSFVLLPAPPVVDWERPGLSPHGSNNEP